MFYLKLWHRSHSTVCSTSIAILLLVSSSLSLAGCNPRLIAMIYTCADWMCCSLFVNYIFWNFFGSKYLYFVQVDGMDALAVKQACKFAKEFALKNGPIVSKLTSHLYLYFLRIFLAFRNDSFILCYIIIDFSILIILSRFSQLDHAPIIRLDRRK